MKRAAWLGLVVVAAAVWTLRNDALGSMLGSSSGAVVDSDDVRHRSQQLSDSNGKSFANQRSKDLTREASETTTNSESASQAFVEGEHDPHEYRRHAGAVSYDPAPDDDGERNADEEERELQRRLSPEEYEILGHFRLMAKAFSSENDCATMERQVDALIAQQVKGITGLVRNRAEMSPNDAREAQSQFERTAGRRLREVREAIRIGVSRCAANTSLMQSLQKLAEQQPG